MAMRPRVTARALLTVVIAVAALASLACAPAPPPDPVNGHPAAGSGTSPRAHDGDHLADGGGPTPPVDAPVDGPPVSFPGVGPIDEIDATAPDEGHTEDHAELPESEVPETELPELELPELELPELELPEPELPEIETPQRRDGVGAAEPLTEPAAEPPVTPAAPAPNESAVASQAQPGDRVVLDVGHVDLVEVTRSGERLVISVKDDTDASGVVFRRPSDVQSRVRDGARTQVPPGPAFDFLGAAGSDVWLLPQVQDPQLLWPGWSTERLGAGQVEGNAVTLRLRSVDGPGRVDLFTTDQFGAPNRIFGPGTSDELTVPINTHTHANWAFSAPGQYRLTFEVSATIAGGGATTSAAEYVFLVGDDTPLVPWESIADPGPGGGGPGGGPGGGGPGDAPGGAGSPTGPGEVSPDGDAGGVGNGPRSVGGGGAGNGGAGSAGSGGAGALARTGGDAGGVLIVGVGLVTFGLVSVGAGRRRRNRAALLGRA